MKLKFFKIEDINEILVDNITSMFCFKRNWLAMEWYGILLYAIAPYIFQLNPKYGKSKRQTHKWDFGNMWFQGAVSYINITEAAYSNVTAGRCSQEEFAEVFENLIDEAMQRPPALSRNKFEEIKTKLYEPDEERRRMLDLLAKPEVLQKLEDTKNDN